MKYIGIMVAVVYYAMHEYGWQDIRRSYKGLVNHYTNLSKIYPGKNSQIFSNMSLIDSLLSIITIDKKHILEMNYRYTINY